MLIERGLNVTQQCQVTTGVRGPCNYTSSRVRLGFGIDWSMDSAFEDEPWHRGSSYLDHT